MLTSWPFLQRICDYKCLFVFQQYLKIIMFITANCSKQTFIFFIHFRRSCPIAWCPGRASNLRRHLAQVHKYLQPHEREEVIESASKLSTALKEMRSDRPVTHKKKEKVKEPISNQPVSSTTRVNAHYSFFFFKIHMCYA